MPFAAGQSLAETSREVAVADAVLLVGLIVVALIVVVLIAVELALVAVALEVLDVLEISRYVLENMSVQLISTHMFHLELGLFTIL